LPIYWCTVFTVGLIKVWPIFQVSVKTGFSIADIWALQLPGKCGRTKNAVHHKETEHKTDAGRPPIAHMSPQLKPWVKKVFYFEGWEKTKRLGSVKTAWSKH
jgi:hypothetical protein